MIWLALYIALSLLLAFVLRQRWAWAQRANDANWRAITLADELAAFLIFVPLHAIGLFPIRPSVGDTISSLSWAGEQFGLRWCRPVRRAIDALFWLLTSQRDHCRKAYAKWANPLGAQS